MERKYKYLLNIQNFADDVDETITEDDVDGNPEPNKDEDTTKNTKKDEENKGKSDRQNNAYQAEQRRKREEQRERERIANEAFLKGQLESCKINTFTNKPITDEHDLKIFKIQMQIKQNGGDPIEDLPLYLAKNEREKAEKEEQQKKQEEEKNKKINDDIAEFKSSHSNVNLGEILEDEEFKTFSEGKLGNESLSKIYDSFLKFKKMIVDNYKKEEKSKKEKEQNFAKSPSSNGNQTHVDKSYNNMTKKEREEYLREQNLII